MMQCRNLIVMAILTLMITGVVNADFTLFGTEQITVDQFHGNGTLYAQSTVYVPDKFEPWSVDNLKVYHESNVYISGGSVDDIDAYDNTTIEVSDGFIDYIYTYNLSTLDISGGHIKYGVYAYSAKPMTITNGNTYYVQANDNSTVNIFGGVISNVYAGSGSVVNIFGGNFVNIRTVANGTIDISGGKIKNLEVSDDSFVTLHAKNYFLGTGLSLSNNEIRGKGILSAQWMDGTGWVMNVDIETRYGGHFISIPEPATLSLLALGSIAVFCRRR